MKLVTAAITPGRWPSRTLLALATLTSSSSSCRRTFAPAAPDEAEVEATGIWAGLRVHTVGERRHPRQVVILLHGWGAPGDDLVPLGDVLEAPGRLLVFPEAPLGSPGGGRAWWALDLARLQAARARGEERDLRQETPPGLAEARAQVTALVAEVARRTRVAPTSLLLGGFSQGAMLATDVTLATPAAVGGLVVLSGSLVAEPEWTAHLQVMKPGFPIFMSHGRGDPVLPFRLAEALRDLVQASHHEVTWVPFQGGHEIPRPVLTGLVAFLAAHAPGDPTAN
jgi:phospholipase/carboxylesterase